jgi:E3 UFM1-protein ligase 1
LENIVAVSRILTVACDLSVVGRVNLVDIQQALNVDYSHIETKVNDLVKNDRGLTLILGQLIDRWVMQLKFGAVLVLS